MSKKPIATKNSQHSQLKDEDLMDNDLSFLDSEMSPELREQFMDSMLKYENAEWVSSFTLLEQGGMALPAPDTLDDTQLSAKLWEVIRGLAMLRMFLHNTDHLSDRELYEDLWHDLLREEGQATPIDADSAWHLDILGYESSEDNALYLRYYADEETRQYWAKD
ncbi:MAG: hypothetical protein Q7U38_05960 [Methylobacter sp.]|nr:hypothetical protein [Methylobacter sp.]MDP2098415.1 hypothetical protein [Methylobacter sp.]MDP2429494.1 hypothetical protein [Methylobacter sp.]MDP3055805.1 hypothetical protein [Methylobacter sp.]MDP3361156.1 hypothetical protein [Methylobacter sp.]